MEDLERLLAQLVQTGKAPPDLMVEIREATGDPARMSALIARLTALAGPAAQETLNIADFYKEADGGKFELRWPLAAENPLVRAGLAFDALDRKTQFFTLFAEWQRRETEGMMALSGGDLDGSERIFRECVERADQINVSELRARAYEDLARLAERRGDQDGVLEWLEKANAERRGA